AHLYEGGTARLQGFSPGLQLQVNKYDSGLYTALESKPPEPPLDRAMNYLEADIQILKLWDSPVGDSIEIQPVHSLIPTLVLAGEMDPITPPSYGRFAARFLPQSYYFEFPAVGHGASVAGACPQEIVLAFIGSPTQPPTAGCIAQMPGIHFQTHIYQNTEVATLGNDLGGSYRAVLLVSLVAIMLLLSLTLMSWITIGLLQWYHGEMKNHHFQYRGLARWVTGLTALSSLVFLGGMANYMMETVQRSDFLLLFGLVGEAQPLFILSYLISLGSLASIFFALQSWRKLWWKQGGRVLYSLVSLSCLWVTVLIFKYALFL
ncbi:MAG: hypothetical protein HC880_19940, partial [Bacteroidia bacterium]|nr:hypothetical protein [Bacteroidia bacterium]